MGTAVPEPRKRRPRLESLTGRQRQAIETFRSEHDIELLTVVFTDGVETTQSTARLGDSAWLAIMTRHTRDVDDLLQRFPAGRLIKSTGDGFLLVFAKPSDAVRFSLLLQRCAAALRAEVEPTFAIRVGIHLGEVVVFKTTHNADGTDVLGLQVNTTARVMALAAPNQILSTRAVWECAADPLRTADRDVFGHIAWICHGEYLLKGLDTPRELWEVFADCFAPRLAPEGGRAVGARGGPAGDPPLAPLDRTQRIRRLARLVRGSPLLLKIFEEELYKTAWASRALGEGETATERPTVTPYCTVVATPPVLSWTMPEDAQEASVTLYSCGADGARDLVTEWPVGGSGALDLAKQPVSLVAEQTYLWLLSYRQTTNWRFEAGRFSQIPAAQLAVLRRQVNQTQGWETLTVLEKRLLLCGLFLEQGRLDELIATLCEGLSGTVSIEAERPMLVLLRRGYLAACERFLDVGEEAAADHARARAVAAEERLAVLGSDTTAATAAPDAVPRQQ